ncbi:MAG: MotA/TolQ/ExbB proton channel family protein [Phycisphaerae bacterium]|nr:MotA/TolQ/ExbB proton channel family protein [Phycisphaerae bacterium]
MILEYFKTGGIMMWPLLVCSILLCAVLFERFGSIMFNRKANMQSGIHKKVLPFFMEIPPSIGLLGTVIGVVQSFGLGDGQITAESAASGLGAACFTTIFGLAISITATIMNFILSWMTGHNHD